MNEHLKTEHTLLEQRREIAKSLLSVAGEESFREASLLLAHITGRSVAMLAAMHDYVLSEAEQNELSLTLARRQTGEPLQYILGEWEFMGLNFKLSNAVLIPRQDTETLTEFALKTINERGAKSALDICCGSGCIGIALGAINGIDITLSDISKDCINIAKINAIENNVAARFIVSDFFAKIEGGFDIITCNPPYLTAEEMRVMQKELKFEPYAALYGGDDGLDAYRVIARDYKAHISKKGVLLLETGYKQAAAVAGLFCGTHTEIINDLNGIPRVVAVYC